MKKFLILLTIQILFSGLSYASGSKLDPKQMIWPFDGPFGTVDRQQAQRGYKVYKEICSACHSMNLVAYRNLKEIGFSEAEVKSIAAQHEVRDGPNDEGEMFNRPGLMSDRFQAPYANEKAARASNNGAYPPDMSLIIKARPDGANYVYSLLVGYSEKPPSGTEIHEGMYYNPYFQNHQISMAPPLSSGIISYDDGTEASIEQMAKDVVVFLQWVSEPEMEKRKRMGVKVLLFLIITTGFFIVAKEIVWKSVK